MTPRRSSSLDCQGDRTRHATKARRRAMAASAAASNSRVGPCRRQCEAAWNGVAVRSGCFTDDDAVLDGPRAGSPFQRAVVAVGFQGRRAKIREGIQLYNDGGAQFYYAGVFQLNSTIQGCFS
ncbi:hypothetical protein MTO96_026264 [Rhipicephalus appendiculatus]